MLCSNTASNKNQKVQTVTIPGGYDCNHIRMLGRDAGSGGEITQL